MKTKILTDFEICTYVTLIPKKAAKKSIPILKTS